MLFVSTESTVCFCAFLAQSCGVHVAHYRKSIVCLRVLDRLSWASIERDCGGALFLCAPQVRGKNKEMFKLMAWYLLERIINIPAYCLMQLHLMVVKKVLNALEHNKQKLQD